MTSTELKINNAVYCKYKQGHFLVKEITETWLRIADPKNGFLYSESYETVLPIDLSPSILEACGFENPEGSVFWYNGKTAIIMPGNGGYENGRLYFNSWFISEPPKHLHILMNVFYYLTGTELTINLEKVKV